MVPRLPEPDMHRCYQKSTGVGLHIFQSHIKRLILLDNKLCVASMLRRRLLGRGISPMPELADIRRENLSGSAQSGLKRVYRGPQAFELGLRRG
jgi:hypothetical protein